MTRVLVVGAGAVGQVFGRHLALGGADVTVFVKAKHVDECRAGFALYPLNTRRHPAVRWDGFGVITTAEEAAKQRWDQVYLTVSSTALRAGTWLAELGKATGDATIVMLQPGLDDRAYLSRFVDPARIVDGQIGFISYHAPLPGETRFAAPGMAYWFPPGSKSPFSGDDARVLPVIAALRAGRLPATRKRDLRDTAAFPSAILFAYLAALEVAHWSFAELRPQLGLGARAATSALAVASHASHSRPALAVRLAARPLVMRMILRLAPWFAPLPLEAYMKAHFTKVGDQTRLALRTYIELGRSAGLDIDALATLAEGLGQG